jgi:hypothetical protein
MVVNVWIGGNHGSGFVRRGSRGGSVVWAIANMLNQNKREKYAGGNHGHFLCLGFHLKLFYIPLT